jgi:hypothetical protein
MRTPSTPEGIVISLGFAVITTGLAMAQRFGNWQSKTVANVIAIFTAAFALGWAYIIGKWMFETDITNYWSRIAYPLILLVLAVLYVWLRRRWPRVFPFVRFVFEDRVMASMSATDLAKYKIDIGGLPPLLVSDGVLLRSAYASQTQPKPAESVSFRISHVLENWGIRSNAKGIPG